MSSAAIPPEGLSGRESSPDEAAPVRCQICGSETVPGLDLGHQPVGDLVVSEAELNEPETFYPMRLHHCYDCGLTQLGYIVDPAIVYKNFPFVSGTTKTATEHLQELAGRLVEMGGLGPDSFAVDIGSNDGTLLKGYLPHGVRFLGVDPAGDPVRIANEQGIETLHAFFDVETAAYVRDHYGRANALSAAGVFAHIADLDGVMRGARILLAEDGIFATDSQYWLDTLQRVHYDNVFHQHLRYYAMRPLQRLFGQYGMEVFDVLRSEVYGGSIQVYAGHAGAYPVSDRVHELLALEDELGLYSELTNRAFETAVQDKRRALFDEIHGRVRQGQRLIGIGAPAKASTVCNYCRIGPELLEYVTEINALRIGTFLPGVHIPIVDEERMFTDEPLPDAAVLFAWNYHDEVVPKLRARGFSGEIVAP